MEGLSPVKESLIGNNVNIPEDNFSVEDEVNMSIKDPSLSPKVLYYFDFIYRQGLVW